LLGLAALVATASSLVTRFGEIPEQRARNCSGFSTAGQASRLQSARGNQEKPMRTHTSWLIAPMLALALVPAVASAEGRTTRNPTFTARRAAQLLIQRETGKLPKGNTIHAHDATYLGYTTKGTDRTDWHNKKNSKLDFEKVVIWQGAERGPGAKQAPGSSGVRVAIVPADKKQKLTPDQLVARTRISRDLTRAGQNKVGAYVRSQGLTPISIKLGDYMKPSKNEYDQHERLSQKPISRANGFLRYTVTLSDGSKRRYEVETIASNLVGNYTSAKNSTKVPADKLLGSVFGDKDVYR
jgi:hypothetical protein